MNQLPREEYVEQAYLFSALAERLKTNEPVQVLLRHIKQELLATTKLPMAVDYLLAELNHSGSMAEAMKRMTHYFTPFQTWLVTQAEDERGRIDIYSVLSILHHEAKFRAEACSRVALFLFQLEVLCRNHLAYDAGLQAMAGDPVYDDAWRKWMLDARRKLGFVDIADLIYVHSQYYADSVKEASQKPDVVLFGEKEGRIGLANRRKDPLFLFAALQRQLNYPPVPKPEKADPLENLVPQLAKKVEQLTTRVKLLEDEQREKGIDLSQFYGNKGWPPGNQGPG
jgi:hypothetical protein